MEIKIKNRKKELFDIISEEPAAELINNDSTRITYRYYMNNKCYDVEKVYNEDFENDEEYDYFIIDITDADNHKYINGKEIYKLLEYFK